MKTFIVFLAFFCQLFISCNQQDSKHDPSLQNTCWILSSIQNTKTKVSLQFPFDLVHTSEYIVFTDSLLSVKGICNSGKSSFLFSSNNDSISISGIGSTFIYCDNGEWEDYLWHNLDSAYSFKITGDQLLIYSKGTYNLNFISH